MTTESAKSTNDFSIEDLITDYGASLESILFTEELTRRPWRPPDYEKENRALVTLASALADSQSNILQILADTILDVTQCDSSGLSLLTKDDGKRFYWPAIAGMWKPHIGGGTPRDFGPCGDVLDQNRTLLFQHFERRYPYLLPVNPPAEECLLVPFYVGGRAVGTIWAIMHSDRRKFDAEDHRIMSTLGQFAALAYQTLASLEDLRLQIATREKAEAALRELAGGLETKVRRLIDSNIIGIFIWGPDARITDANDTFLRMVGYGRDDVVSGGLRWRELTPAEFHDADDRREAELKATGTAQPYEKEYFVRGGDRVPVLVGAALFEGKGNEGVAFVVDLTDRKRADEAARESERRLYGELQEREANIRRLINSALDAVLGIDEQGRITEWNMQAETMFGWRCEEAAGRRLAEMLIPMRYRAAHEEGLRHFLSSGEGPILNRRVEITALRRDGSEFPIELSIAPYRIGGTWAFSGFVRDITERKRLYSDLQEREAKVRRLVDSNIIGIFIWGLDGRIIDANEAFLRMVGYGRDDVVSGGLRWRELTPAEFGDADDRREAELTATGTAQPYEKEYFHRSGGRVPVLVGAALFEDNLNEGVAFVVDLTDRKRAEKAASESDRRYREVEMELAHANRVAGMGQLSASIAHEVRQPVAATVTNAQAALRWLGARPPNLEEVRQALSRIVKDASRASEVVGRIHGFIKKTPSRKEAFEINGSILEVIALTSGEAVKHGISVHTQLAEGLPLIQGDRIQLQQVIFNLMMNAVEAMSGVREGPRELLISTEKAESDDVLVAVRDSGPGLAPESLGRVFEAFYTTKPSGLGMGLSICRSIIEAHGGRLWATANVPRGALFQFTVPVPTKIKS